MSKLLSLPTPVGKPPTPSPIPVTPDAWIINFVRRRFRISPRIARVLVDHIAPGGAR